MMLRPTQSLGLYLQMVGRALRPAPGKEHALVLDFAGNCNRHGLPDEPQEWSLESKRRRERKGTAEPAVRRCENCGALNSRAVMQCTECHADLRTPKERHEVEMRLREAERQRQADEIRGWSYPRRLVWAGDNEERLRLVAMVCGYKRGWVHHRLAELGGARG